jgi:segregation and condensation protein B
VVIVIVSAGRGRRRKEEETMDEDLDDAEGVGAPATHDEQPVGLVESAADADGPDGEAGEERGPAPVDPPPSLEELKKALEAVLFAAAEPLPIRQLAQLFGAPIHDVREAIEELKFEYVESGRAFRLEEVAGGAQLLTLPAYDPWIRKLRQSQSRWKLSPAAFETLAVVAYKQPITKADLEAIRGVQCSPVLKNLLDRGLVRVTGRDESLGRPLLYGTTAKFLESFGISNLRDLPQPELRPRRESAGEEDDDSGEREDTETWPN